MIYTDSNQKHDLRDYQKTKDNNIKMNKKQEEQLQTIPQNTEILIKIIKDFNEKVIRELKMVGFNKREATMILKIYSMPLIDALKGQQETLLKAEHQRGFIEGSDITGRIAEEVNACERQEIIEIIEKMRFYNQDYELEVWIKKIKKDIIKAITNK